MVPFEGKSYVSEDGFWSWRFRSGGINPNITAVRYDLDALLDSYGEVQPEFICASRDDTLAFPTFFSTPRKYMRKSGFYVHSRSMKGFPRSEAYDILFNALGSRMIITVQEGEDGKEYLTVGCSQYTSNTVAAFDIAFDVVQIATVCMGVSIENLKVGKWIWLSDMVYDPEENAFVPNHNHPKGIWERANSELSVLRAQKTRIEMSAIIPTANGPMIALFEKKTHDLVFHVLE